MSVHRWKSRIFALVIAPLACSGGAEKSTVADETSAAPLEGAWRLVEFQLGDAPAVVNPASVYLFTGRHYSVTYANIAVPRVMFATPDAPTDAEKVLAYNTIVANSGTFEMMGDTLITHPVIARNPNFMGGQDRFVMRMAGDTLRLANVPGGFRWANGQPDNTQTKDTYTLVRER